MSSSPDLAEPRPVPEPDDVTEPYWAGAREGMLVITRCSQCRLYVHPPDVGCPRCLTETLVPEQVSGRGTVYTFAVAHQAFDRPFVSRLPYVIALIELVEQPGLRLLTNIVESAAERCAIGAAVEVTFESVGSWSLPQFRLVAGGLSQ